MRIGQGYDLHRLVPNRPLILGGVDVPHHLGLLGHSDADVLLHAIADACLGAAGLGDIGRHFPDSDSQWEGVQSLELLRIVFGKCTQSGLKVGNIDATIIAQKPKLAPYVAQMESNIAEVLSISDSLVNVKATTTESLGVIGRDEAIAAHAVVLLLPI